jgi:hypothetical protein
LDVIQHKFWKLKEPIFRISWPRSCGWIRLLCKSDCCLRFKKKDFFKSRTNLDAHNLSNCCLTDTTHSHIPTMRTSRDFIFNKDSTLLTWLSILNRPVVVWLEDMACNLHLWAVISPQQSISALVRGAVINGWWGKING